MSQPAIEGDTLIEWEEVIDESDAQARNGFENGVLARWHSGRIMIAARVGKRLPNGKREEFVRETGKSPQELGYRMQLADTYSTIEELSNALDSFDSWRELAKSLSKSEPKPEPKPDNVIQLPTPATDDDYEPLPPITDPRVIASNLELKIQDLLGEFSDIKHADLTDEARHDIAHYMDLIINHANYIKESIAK